MITQASTWDSHRPVRPLQAGLCVAAGFALVPAVISTLLRVIPPRADAPALLASFIAYGVVFYVLALFLLLFALRQARRRAVLGGLCGVVAALTALHASWLAPFFLSDHRAARTPTFTIMSLNLLDGRADPGQVVQVAAKADVVVLVETTPEVIAGLRRLGWSQRFPYAVGAETSTESDTAVFSRFPLDPGTLINTSFQQWMTTVHVPRVGAVRLMAVHPCNPFCGGDRWASEHDVINRVAQANLDQPMVVAGDFNAVDDQGPMQALRRIGLESATDIAGAGWLPTWPANRPYPPLIPIDHVMISSRLTATSVTTFAVSGTDHRGLLTTLAGA